MSENLVRFPKVLQPHNNEIQIFNKYCLHIAQLIHGKKIANQMKTNIYLTKGSPVTDLSMSSKGDDAGPTGTRIVSLVPLWVRKYDTACNDKNFMLQYLTHFI